MKKKFVIYALLICTIVSVTSGCVVREGYGGHRYHDRYHYRDHDHDGYWHDDHHDNRGY